MNQGSDMIGNLVEHVAHGHLDPADFDPDRFRDRRYKAVKCVPITYGSKLYPARPGRRGYYAVFFRIQERQKSCRFEFKAW